MEHNKITQPIDQVKRQENHNNSSSTPIDAIRNYIDDKIRDKREKLKEDVIDEYNTICYKYSIACYKWNYKQRELKRANITLDDTKKQLQRAENALDSIGKELPQARQSLKSQSPDVWQEAQHDLLKAKDKLERDLLDAKHELEQATKKPSVQGSRLSM